MNIYDILFEVLRVGLFSGQISDQIKKELNTETLKKLFNAAKKHDVAHLVGYSLDKLGLLDKTSDFGKTLENEQYLAVYRYENIKYELGRICNTLDKTGISFMLLKGAVIRQYYPEPWLRTSCDIDILVKEEDVESAVKFLCEKLGYENRGKTEHDYQIFAPSGVHLELHYVLINKNTFDHAEKVLEQVWENSVLIDGYGNCYKMNDSMFYYYHLVHMAKHIKNGGCGIRPFLDLFILKKIQNGASSLEEMLKKGRLEAFDRIANKLASVWFDRCEVDGQTQRLADFVLYGGVYGNLENSIAVNQNLKGGSFKYAMSRIFLPYDALKFRYPVLNEKKWLFIPYQFKRWYELLFKGSARRSLRELKLNQTISGNKLESASKMWEDMGL